MKAIALVLIVAGIIFVGGEYDTIRAQMIGGLAGVTMLGLGALIARRRF